jgi:hypothetical protein
MGKRRYDCRVNRSSAHQESDVVTNWYGIEVGETEVYSGPTGEVGRKFCEYRWDVPPECDD